MRKLFSSLFIFINMKKLIKQILEQYIEEDIKDDLKWRDVQTKKGDGKKIHTSVFFTEKFKYKLTQSINIAW